MEEELREVFNCDRPFTPDDPDDIITIARAVKESGRSKSAIGNLLDRKVLPWYQRVPLDATIPGEHPQRFTSLKAVLGLPPVRRKTRRTRGR